MTSPDASTPDTRPSPTDTQPPTETQPPTDTQPPTETPPPTDTPASTDTPERQETSQPGGYPLHGAIVTLRTAVAEDIDDLVAIRSTPQVHARWRGDDLRAEITESIEDDDLAYLAVVLDGRVIGAIQWAAETDPDYRHASIDIFLDPAVHGQGIGTDAVRTLATHLIDEQDFHRIVIDPAADNTPAIRCYANVGFRPVGIMRDYERDAAGGWHDGLLMDLLAAELIRRPASEKPA